MWQDPGFAPRLSEGFYAPRHPSLCDHLSLFSVINRPPAVRSRLTLPPWPFRLESCPGLLRVITPPPLAFSSTVAWISLEVFLSALGRLPPLPSSVVNRVFLLEPSYTLSPSIYFLFSALPSNTWITFYMQIRCFRSGSIYRCCHYPCFLN